MADLSVTQAQVVPGTAGSPSFEMLVAAEVIDVGEVYYIDSNGKAALADNSTAIKAAAKGICVSAALAVGQYVVGQKNKSLTLGATAAPGKGTPYYVSANPGKLCVLADLTTGKFVTPLGLGDAANAFAMSIQASGIAHA